MDPDKQEFRKKIFEGMCDVAENIMGYIIGGAFSKKVNYLSCPLPFRPTTGDKKIFQNILDKVIDKEYEIWLKDSKEKIHYPLGASIMLTHYYPPIWFV